MLNGWVEEIESEVLEFLRGHQPVSLPDLASALRISEALALSYIGILARERKVTIGGLGIRDDHPQAPLSACLKGGNHGETLITSDDVRVVTSRSRNALPPGWNSASNQGGG